MSHFFSFFYYQTFTSKPKSAPSTLLKGSSVGPSGLATHKSTGLFSVLILSDLSSIWHCWLSTPCWNSLPWSLRFPSQTLDLTTLHRFFFLFFPLNEVLLRVFLIPFIRLSLCAVFWELVNFLQVIPNLLKSKQKKSSHLWNFLF